MNAVRRVKKKKKTLNRTQNCRDHDGPWQIQCHVLKIQKLKMAEAQIGTFKQL